MRTRIKVCGVTRPCDAVSAVEAGADAIGLVFYAPSPRAVTLKQAADLCRHIPAFVTITALFVNAEADVVREHIESLPIDLLQFHGDESVDYCESFQRPYIKALRVKPGLDLRAACQQYRSARALLLDAYRAGVPGGTGETFDWSLIPQELELPWVLAGGLTADNVRKAIAQTGAYAVDVSGGVEAAKGIKDPARIQQFFNEVSCVNRN